MEADDSLNIQPCTEAGEFRTGTLTGVTIKQITDTLGGIKPLTGNDTSDPDKVKVEWMLLINDDICGIWDFKGSASIGMFSTYGKDEYFARLFGSNYSRFG